ncbi:MAG: hypothetical protein JOZ71_06150 [Ktedonobacteraceae bacterium]|nr:hypothetical protein [Ktedonobacteraceae bacterium]
MQINGLYTFQASKERVFVALLDPGMLQKSVPGCSGAWYSSEQAHTKIRIITPVPGLEGPYDITMKVLEQDAPHKLVLQIGRNGRSGGTVAARTHVTLTDAPDGDTLLSYDTIVELSGAIAAVNNPLFIGIAKQMLKTFFKNLNTAMLTGE